MTLGSNQDVGSVNLQRALGDPFTLAESMTLVSNQDVGSVNVQRALDGSLSASILRPTCVYTSEINLVPVSSLTFHCVCTPPPPLTGKNLNPKAACLKRREEEKAKNLCQGNVSGGSVKDDYDDDDSTDGGLMS